MFPTSPISITSCPALCRNGYQRDFGVPAPKSQDSFADPESRIVKRAGGGFDYSYNAQTVVDETAHIIVATEVVNTSSDIQQLPMVLSAVKEHTGTSPVQVLADACPRRLKIDPLGVSFQLASTAKRLAALGGALPEMQDIPRRGTAPALS